MNAYMWTSRRVGAALVITLVGCGGGDDPEDSSTTDATTAAATAGTSDPSGDPSTTTAGASESDATDPATSDPTTEPATSDPTTTTTDPTTDPSETTDTGVDPGVPAIHYVGRHDASDPSYVRMGWSGVGAVIRFDGTAASVRLDDNAGYFTVVVDGVVQAPLLTSPGDQLYPLAQDLPPGEHVVELYRRTEGSFGPTVILDVELAGELLPPPPVTRRIEVIGDSISCGYGNEGEAPCSFSAATENHYNTYGAFAARAVGAELSTIAWSGKGVVYNYGDDTFEPLPELYDRLLATDAAPWGFDWQPDVVVINLGTNDFSTDNDPPEDLFVPAYVEFLAHLRDVYPDAFLLPIAPSLWGDEVALVAGYLESAVAQRHADGDLDVAFADVNVEWIGSGCDGHPTVATHELMGARLVEELGVHLGW